MKSYKSQKLILVDYTYFFILQRSTFMRLNESENIRTPLVNIRVAEKRIINGRPVAAVKHKKKEDTMTIQDFVHSLYGPEYGCMIYKQSKEGLQIIEQGNFSFDKPAI
jgi:hypothetical protein